jgi:hypothetical protein
MPSLGIAPGSGGCTALLHPWRQSRHRFQASFRRAWRSHLLEAGLQAIQLSPYRADLPAHRPVRLGTAAGFLACYCPLHLSDLGSAIRSRDISSHLCPLRGRYNTAPRGAAAAEYSNQRSRWQSWSAAYKRSALDGRRRSCAVPLACIQMYPCTLRAPSIGPQWASEVWNGHQGASMRPSRQRRFRRPQDRIRWSEWVVRGGVEPPTFRFSG